MGWVNAQFQELEPGMMGPILELYAIGLGVLVTSFVALGCSISAVRRARRTGLGWPETLLAFTLTVVAFGIAVYRVVYRVRQFIG